MALSYRLILSPSAATRSMLARRMAFAGKDAADVESAAWGAALLIQGTVPEVFYAVDVGTKTAPVTAREVVGSCPQNVVSVAFIGAVSDVKQVLTALRSEGVVA